jgi:hypothetical protein
MRRVYAKDIKELHERNYSIYDDAKTEQSALQELHNRSYYIFDEEETTELLVEYYEEFDRLAHEVSFYSLRWLNKTQDLFLEVPKVTGKRVEPQKNEESVSVQEDIAENNRKALIGEIISMVEHHIEIMDTDHVFYIYENDTPFRQCNAIGRYDPLAKCFVLLQGSLLSLDVDSSFRYSAGEMQRRIFIQKNCMRNGDGYYLKKDTICSTPDQAASYVLGKVANGKDVWMDDAGNTLAEVYHIKS